jgi:hypothetical protein
MQRFAVALARKTSEGFLSSGLSSSVPQEEQFQWPHIGGSDLVLFALTC